MPGTVTLVIDSPVAQGKMVEVGVTVDGATRGTAVTATLKGGSPNVVQTQTERANFNGRATFEFELSYEKAGTFVVTASAHQAGQVAFAPDSKQVEVLP